MAVSCLTVAVRCLTVALQLLDFVALVFPYWSTPCSLLLSSLDPHYYRHFMATNHLANFFFSKSHLENRHITNERREERGDEVMRLTSSPLPLPFFANLRTFSHS